MGAATGEWLVGDRLGGEQDAAERDAGAVTVEAAIALCGFIVVFAIALAGVSAITDQLRCTDAAREAARLTARGETDRARSAASRVAPRGAQVDIQTSGDEITVTVTATPAAGLLPGVTLRGQAYAVAEPVAASGAGARP